MFFSRHDKGEMASMVYNWEGDDVDAVVGQFDSGQTRAGLISQNCESSINDSWYVKRIEIAKESFNFASI